MNIRISIYTLLLCLVFTSCYEKNHQKHEQLTLLFDGNSIPSGYLLKHPYPELIRDKLKCKIINVSVGGQTTLQMIKNIKAVNKTECDLLIVDEISNDLFFKASANEAYDHIKQYCTLSEKKCIIITPTPRENQFTPIDFESNRQQVISLLKHDFKNEKNKFVTTNSSYAIGLIDLSQDSLIGFPFSDTNRVYFQDQCHHTELGNMRRADIIANGIKIIIDAEKIK